MEKNRKIILKRASGWVNHLIHTLVKRCLNIMHINKYANLLFLRFASSTNERIMCAYFIFHEHPESI